jgi:hypothetical protein
MLHPNVLCARASALKVRTVSSRGPLFSSAFGRGSSAAWLLAGVLTAVGGTASGQANLPDAQVEANVLKALASAPQLATESITTRTVYGTVTLSGFVGTEAARVEAENLAANAIGVTKVIDELQLGTGSAIGSPMPSSSQPASAAATMPTAPPAGQVLLSDGSYGPDPAASSASSSTPGAAPGSAPAETAQRNNPDADQALDAQGQSSQGSTLGSASTPAVPMPSAPRRRPVYAPGYPGYGYPSAAGIGANSPTTQPLASQPPMGGQLAGQTVTIPAGAMLRVRMNRTLRSGKTPAGTTFDATVVNDVVADGYVAIPRGASVQGTVVDVKNSHALSGRGELSMQLTTVTLGGKSYRLSSDVWNNHGGDKTIESVNKTAVGGGVGALFGAAAAGGRGAAVGAGVGGLLGLASAASSGRGEVVVPAESILTFHTDGPTEVATVSEQEMQRLAYGVPYSAERPPVRRSYRVYPGYYPPPGYGPYPGQAYPYPY